MTDVAPTKPPISMRTALIGMAAAANLAWGVWATHSLLELQQRRIVTVQLARVMGEFVEAESRSGRDAQAMRARIATYLKATENAVAALGKDGATVLVAEAVVGGGAPDMTDVVRARVARSMAGGDDVRR